MEISQEISNKIVSDERLSLKKLGDPPTFSGLIPEISIEYSMEIPLEISTGISLQISIEISMQNGPAPPEREVS